jgi:xylan 1,4-beta-xylosidase
MRDRKYSALLLLLTAVVCTVGQNFTTKYFQVKVDSPVGPWTHFWENCVGSGHAALALRADYQDQMRQARRDLGFQQVRFHGLFVDDMSVVLNNNHGEFALLILICKSVGPGLTYSFFNIDRIFDFFVGIGMKPLVEVGFMPSLLASGNKTWSHWDANVTPPKNWNDWYDLVSSFAAHLIERYGEEEILTWNFEVWNEPNCCPRDFWTGSQLDYFYLFNVTSKALKSVNPKIRVGGPATGTIIN